MLQTYRLEHRNQSTLENIHILIVLSASVIILKCLEDM
jgi:hypothetical protein